MVWVARKRVMIWLRTLSGRDARYEGDGIYIRYSAFDAGKSLQRKFPFIHYMNTQPCAGFNPDRGATHVMIFAKH